MLLVCGIDNCHKVVGEIRGDKALMHNKFGDRTVPYTPRHTEESLGFPPGTVLRDARTGETLEQQQDRKFDDLDRETLRYVEDDRRVARRYDAGSQEISIDLVGHFVCPEHGVVELPDPDAVVERLRSFVANTQIGSRRKYFMFRG